MRKKGRTRVAMWTDGGRWQVNSRGWEYGPSTLPSSSRRMRWVSVEQRERFPPGEGGVLAPFDGTAAR